MSSNQVHQPVSNSKTFPKYLQQMWANLDVQSTAVLMVIAIAVGLGTGLTAVIFIKAINWITEFSFTGALSDFLSPLGNAWIILVPIIGSLISGPIIAFWAIEAKGHGVPEVMQAIIMKDGGRLCRPGRTNCAGWRGPRVYSGADFKAG
jgi:H+/Cl- antiporter ClcA